MSVSHSKAHKNKNLQHLTSLDFLLVSKTFSVFPPLSWYFSSLGHGQSYSITFLPSVWIFSFDPELNSAEDVKLSLSCLCWTSSFLPYVVVLELPSLLYAYGQKDRQAFNEIFTIFNLFCLNKLKKKKKKGNRDTHSKYRTGVLPAWSSFIGKHSFLTLKSVYFKELKTMNICNWGAAAIIKPAYLRCLKIKDEYI